MHSLFAHSGVGRRFVHAVKFDNDRAIVRWLGTSLAETVRALGIDMITWAPTTAVRRRGRGYDQARLLAGATARALGVPSKSSLKRQGGGSQAGEGRLRRLQGPVFEATRSLDGVAVLLVDDVLTTGATARSAVAALWAAGASRIHVAVCSRTGQDSMAQKVEVGDRAA